MTRVRTAEAPESPPAAPLVRELALSAKELALAKQLALAKELALEKWMRLVMYAAAGGS